MIIKKLFLLLLLLSSNALALNPDELLKPDEAFKTSAVLTPEGNIKVVLDIADGYYLYKDKTHIKSKAETVSLGEFSLPKGEMKNDPYLGKMEVFHDTIAIEVPIQQGATASSFDLELKYQGCAEAGLCYPPQKKLFPLQLAANTQGNETATSTDAAPTASGMQNLSKSLGISGIGNSSGPLSPDEAFKYSLSADGNTLNAIWSVTPDHYLYKDKIKFIVKSPDGITLGEPVLPAAKEKTDPYLGTHEVYEHDFSVQVPIASTSGDTISGEVVIETTYQGCAEIAGICYPPQKKTHTVTLASLTQSTATTNATTNTAATALAAASTQKAIETPAKSIEANQPPSTKETTAKEASTKETSNTAAGSNQITGKCEAASGEERQILNKLTSASKIGAIFIFFLIGLGLAFTPCIYPMIPILSSIIVGQGEKVSTKKAFSLSLAYVLPMALIYAIAGYFVGNSGESLQAMFQNPWVISAFAIIFILLSLSMFGFYELQMPASIQSKLTNISNSQESGSLIGAAIMGALSALIVGPCVTAPLMAAFTYIAQIGSPLLGSIDMLALGLGIGLPLILIGTSAGKLLPKAGAWMETTKAIFGVMMIGMAIWMLERILPMNITMLLAAILLVVTAIYMGALESIQETASKWRYMWKGLGLLTLVYGLLLIVGVAAGSGNLYQPLKGVFTASAENEHEIEFQQIKGLKGLNAALASAKEQNRPVMLDFYADWCTYCKVMERTTFADKDVIESLGNTLFLQADITDYDDVDKELLKAYNLLNPPMMLFFDTKGIELTDYRLVGEIKPVQLATHAKSFMNCVK